eukprot:4579740-Pyramimonas_sp.AAC.1
MIRWHATRPAPVLGGLGVRGEAARFTPPRISSVHALMGETDGEIHRARMTHRAYRARSAHRAHMAHRAHRAHSAHRAHRAHRAHKAHRARRAQRPHRGSEGSPEAHTRESRSAAHKTLLHPAGPFGSQEGPRGRADPLHLGTP